MKKIRVLNIKLKKKDQLVEELEEDELEDLREYRLEQMPNSNGCGLTRYDEGPNERTEDVEHQPPIYPNGGTGEKGQSACHEIESWVTVWDCHTSTAYGPTMEISLDICRARCEDWYTTEHEPGGGLSCEFDYGEFWDCLLPDAPPWDNPTTWLAYGTCTAALVSAVATGGLSSKAVALACSGTAAEVYNCGTNAGTCEWD